MEVYRIAQEKYAEDLSGNGARLYGGRWNSENIFALYVSSSRSLALLETLAHAPAKMLLYKNYQLVSLQIPEESIESVNPESLPAQWNQADSRKITRIVGDRFLLGKNNFLLAVPSVIIPEEKNYVINPLHPLSQKIKILHKRKIDFDNRVVANL
ncbi:MAG: RES family NAD+ phosphorylase [Chitinophagaceae bacterium]|nr:RES family NAD+ phosphorylase [Chitinophagaceae bacterium]MCB0741871.1 RES family NAD+ phosphorylase [Chitinophagaceae bacterium]HQU57198.1 RES family NAD+ phosphorylase [Chitinophagaceae bacterium]